MNIRPTKLAPLVVVGILSVVAMITQTDPFMVRGGLIATSVVAFFTLISDM